MHTNIGSFTESTPIQKKKPGSFRESLGHKTVADFAEGCPEEVIGVCVCVRVRVSVRVRVRVRLRLRLRVRVRVCVCERERVCVCVGESV